MAVFKPGSKPRLQKGRKSWRSLLARKPKEESQNGEKQPLVIQTSPDASSKVVEALENPEKNAESKADAVHTSKTLVAAYDELFPSESSTQTKTVNIVRSHVHALFEPEGVPSCQGNFLADNRNVNRFIRARKGDLKKAAQQLHDTIVWRKKYGLNDAGVDISVEDYKQFCFFPVGLDKRNRVIIYFNHGRLKNSMAEESFLHAFRVFEDCFVGDITHCVWIVDLNGFGMEHCSMHTASVACKWFGTYLPERLGQIVLLKPSSMFKVMHSIVSRFIDPESATKIKPLRNEKEVDSYFSENFNESTSEWLKQVAKLQPVIGGAFPYGTDLSLVHKTKYIGAPRLEDLLEHTASDRQWPPPLVAKLQVSTDMFTVEAVAIVDEEARKEEAGDALSCKDPFRIAREEMLSPLVPKDSPTSVPPANPLHEDAAGGGGSASVVTLLTMNWEVE
eukprot:CAMPEP_0185759056 /NCGR_PEP_ID=MMETSP1174-20130828/17750_1 /TAXON_ID=35687 /ORGANISM="Dictyocha speculum, Strain CCMP1381" /LENGTH=447 /DNA_ID=CAMNT_0028439203 /DNA_START=29 /DNA_END=1374 /DNA_ORIENTATION=-